MRPLQTIYPYGGPAQHPLVDFHLNPAMCTPCPPEHAGKAPTAAFTNASYIVEDRDSSTNVRALTGIVGSMECDVLVGRL